MLWNIDGEEIEVLAREGGDMQIVRWDEFHKCVHVPAHLSKAEAIWSLRNLLRDAPAAPTVVEMGTISMFDRNWSVIYKNAIKTPFMKHNCIYCSIKGKKLSTTQQDKLREHFLAQWILERLGYWEEYLNVMSPPVAFRKNKTAVFTLVKGGGAISFDKGLVRFKRELVDYCVLLALGRYFAIDHSIVDSLCKRTFPSQRMFDKIIQYEYDTRNSD